MKRTAVMLAILASGCASPQKYTIPGHPGWTYEESIVPLKGLPDEPPGACGFQRPNRMPGPPPVPCGMTDAVTICSTKTVKVWWYARPGAFDHELTHVAECEAHHRG